MPSEERPSSPGPADGSDNEQPSSPKHVFDDDIEMKSVPVDASNPQDADGAPSTIPQGEAGQSTAEPTNNQDAHNIQQPETPTPPPAHTQPSSNKETPDDQPLPVVEPSQDDQALEQLNPDSSVQSPLLFDTMLHKPSSSPGLVTAWMSHVSNNGPDAMAAIISLVISAARPVPFSREQLITSDMIIANQPEESVKGLCQILAVDAPEKVVVLAKDTPSRRVRRTYEDFWRRIAAEAPDIVLYHTDCFDTLIPWLEVMSISPIRALRVSASLAAYRLVDGFIEVSTPLRKHLASIQRQLNTEKRRSGISHREDSARGAKKRAAQGKGKKKELSAKGKELANKVDELTAKNSELTDLSERVYRTIFIGRYRDISADIRSMSISTLGGWIMMFPDQFLDDTHSKYIGWLLSDKDASVRKTSLEVLQRVLKKKEYFASFETFLQRFCDRIVEMATDKDDAVAAAAIRLLNFLLPHNSNDKLLRPDQCESICDIALQDHHTDVRRAAGEFLATMVTMDIDDLPSSASKRRRSQRKRSGKRTSTGPFNTLLREIPAVDRAREDIRELLFAIVRKEDEEVDAALAVDAVWDYLPSLRCWQAFEELLLEDQPSDPANEDGEALNDDEKGVLCKMLLASAVEASGNGDPMRAKMVEKGEYSDPETPGTLLSKQFLPLLPRLLSQYQSDPVTISTLAQLPRHFTMTTFEQQGQDGHFSVMLERIIGALVKHTGSEDVTSACAETLRYFLSEQNPLKKATCTSLQLCCQRVSKDLALQIRTDLAKAEPDNVAALMSQLRILTELVDSDSSTYEAVKEVLEFQERNGDSSGLSTHVTIDASRSACAFAVWSLSKIRSRLITTGSSETSHETILEQEEVQEYRKQGADVIDILQRICGCDSVPLTARLLCSRCILIILTLCRGIEKNLSMMILRKRTESDNASSAAPDLDLLSLKESIPQLVDMIRAVVTTLVEYELKLSSSRGSGGNRVHSTLQEREVRDFFASLVQASLQSLLSRHISHLPLFGVLLKPEKEPKGSEVNEYTSSRVCRDYLQQRQIRGNALARDVVRALHEVLKLQCGRKKQQGIIRELADICVSFRHRRDLKTKGSMDLLRALFDHCSKALDDTDFVGKLFVLSSSSFALLSHFSEEEAKGMMESMKTIDDLRNKYAEALDDEVIDLFDHFHSSLEAVADGRPPELPPMIRASDRSKSHRGPRSRRRKRTASPRSHTPPPEPSNVRKSLRQKVRVDYARMENYLSEDNEDGSEEGVSEPESEDISTKATTAADVAKNMMEYQNSPVAVRKRAEREVPDASLNPPKRRRRSSNSTSKRETSPAKQRPESSGTDSALRNSTPKGTKRARPSDQNKSNQKDSQDDDPRVLEEQASDLKSKEAEPLRKEDRQIENDDGEEQEAITSSQKHRMTRRSGNRDRVQSNPSATRGKRGRTHSSPQRSLTAGHENESEDVARDTTPQREDQQSQQTSKYTTRGSRQKSSRSSEQSPARAPGGASNSNFGESTADRGPKDSSCPPHTSGRPRRVQGSHPDEANPSQKSDVTNENGRNKRTEKENTKEAPSNTNGQVKPSSKQGLIRRRKVRRW